MDKVWVSPAAGSVVWICCDSMEGYDWKGRLYTRYAKGPTGFRNAGELISILEKFYDRIGYPQASMIERRFCEIAAKPDKKREKEERQVVVVGMEEMERQRGEKATFVVRIQYRQNATWQGQVTWAEKNKTINFRSALELLKLMDSTASIPEGSWEE